jgi:hypothetical protein
MQSKANCGPATTTRKRRRGRGKVSQLATTMDIF